MTAATRRSAESSVTDADDAVLAVLIAAMDANAHVSPDEAARAQHIIWSTRRFRGRSEDDVNRRIDRLRSAMEQHGAAAVLDLAAPQIPVPLRAAAFAVAADIVLADGRTDAMEAQFLRQLAGRLSLADDEAQTILAAMRTKNGL